MTFKAGAAHIIITPPVGVELAGYSFGPSLGILDDLEAQALVIESGSTTLVLVTADLLCIGPDLTTRVRHRVEKELGIPGVNILLSASHTHSGPTTTPFRQWGLLDETYLNWLEAALVGLIGLAQRNLQPARLGLGAGRVDNISGNRRGHPQVRDQGVPVMRLDNLSNQPLAIMYNFGCHPVSLHSYRNLITPDYPGYARQTVQAILGQETTVMFSLGTAGDINPVGYVPQTFTPADSRKFGAILGCEAAKVALDPAWQDDPVVSVTRRVIDLPVEPLPSAEALKEFHAGFVAEDERLRAAGETWEQIARVEIQRDWAADALLARAEGRVQPNLACEVMAVCLGAAEMIAAPLELFTETGLAIKAGSPAPFTWVVSNANGALGYLPTLDAYTEDDYTNPEGLAPKVYGIYAFTPEAEPIFRREVGALARQIFQ